MYFSRITLLQTAVDTLRLFDVLRDPYSLHQSIWELFADHGGRRRDFLYRLDLYGEKPLVYAVSERQPGSIHALWYVESKLYKPVLRAGMKLAFMLRANPVVTKKPTGERTEAERSKRHDVVMEAKMRWREDGHQAIMAELAQEEGTKWLLNRAVKHGFDLNEEQVRVDAYLRHRFFKKKGLKPVQFSTLDFTGVLAVTDPGLFARTLFAGIGPAKGFGCGLMLVRRT